MKKNIKGKSFEFLIGQIFENKYNTRFIKSSFLVVILLDLL